jgi:predicted site-specific integrase-resolvase
MAFLRQAGAARYCGMSVNTFRRWVRAGKVPLTPDPMTSTVWFTTEALDAWMATLPEQQAS